MTQHCHKDRALNQQCCDREHEEEERKEYNIHNKTTHTTHTTLPFSAHTTATQRESRQHNTRESNAKEDWTMRDAGSNSKTGNTAKRTGDNTRQRDNTTSHHSPPFNGTTMQTEGGYHTQDGESVTLPPFPHHATHHPLCPPIIHDSPTPHHDERGDA